MSVTATPSLAFGLASDLGRLAQDGHDARSAAERVEALDRDYPERAARQRIEAEFAE